MLIKCICVMPHCKHFAVFRLILIKRSKINQTKFTEGKGTVAKERGNSAQMQNGE